MSVLCCRIPDFLFGLALRRDPGLGGRAVALLGSDERVWGCFARSATVRRADPDDGAPGASALP
jgi:hypothetical protein